MPILAEQLSKEGQQAQFGASFKGAQIYTETPNIETLHLLTQEVILY